MAAVVLSCIGCSNDCAEVADLLRRCCARGPAELRARCEAEADQLEEDGDIDACEADLERGTYEACKS